MKDWLWDRRISEKRARRILKRPMHPKFISLSSLLLSRKNSPQEIFKAYLRAEDFCRHWRQIKRNMRKDNWNNPRIEFWQAVYEKLIDKYRARGVDIFLKIKRKDADEFCLEAGNKIKALRKQKGFSQKIFAKKLNISQQMVSRIESGRENVSLLTLKKILDELGGKIIIE